MLLLSSFLMKPRGTPYDVRVTAVPPPSPTRKKSDKEAIAVPEDNSKLEPKGTKTTEKSNSNDNDIIPVSEEKSPIKPEESSAKLLSAKAHLLLRFENSYILFLR